MFCLLSKKLRWIDHTFSLTTPLLLCFGTPGLGMADGAKKHSTPVRHARQKSHPDAVVEVVGVTPSVVQETIVDPLASSVTIITSEQIENLKAQDLPSALRRAPGVVISRHNPVGSFGGGEGGSVFLHGMGISRPGAEIQILVDGAPKAVGVWTHPLMDVLNVDIMERIEVYKGAQPVLFGHSAFGAISITSKSVKEEAPLTSLELAGGSYRSAIEVLQHGAKKGPIDYYLVQSLRRSNGHREASGGELQNYFGRITYAFPKHWQATLMLNGTNNWADDPGRADGSTPRQGRFKTNDLFAVATLSHRHKEAEGHIKLYRESGHIRWAGQFNTATKKSDVETNTDYDNYGLRLRELLTPWPGGHLTLGMDLDFIGGQVEYLAPPAAPNRFKKTTFRISSPYFAHRQTFGSRSSWYIAPSAGARFLKHSEFGHTTGTQFGLTGGYRDTECHAAFAHGLNYPGVYVKAQDQMFMPGDNRWRNLKPETVNHVELGISHHFGDSAKLEINIFQNKGKDRIEVLPPPPFPPVFTNFGVWQTQGMETTLTLSPTRNLTFFASGTHLDTKPSDLPYAPKRSGTIGTNYRFLEHLQLSADLLYVGGQFVSSRNRATNAINTEQVGAYALLNIKLAWDFAINTIGAGQAFLSMENLGNRTYEQKKHYPMPGINGIAGIKIHFQKASLSKK